jgi:hypothetical protein
MHGWQARVLAIAVIGLVALGVVAAAVADDRQVHHTAAGQAAAKAVVIHRADLGSTPGWTGGVKKPDNTPDPTCSGYDPKQSDLVEIGDVETDWENKGLTFDSEASVLETPAMVRLDWQRSVLDPGLLPCLRKALVKALPKTARVVSARRVAFPALATYSRAFRLLIDMPAAAGKVRVFTDVVVLGRGQTEITLTTLAPYAGVREVQAAEVRLAIVMLLRVRM